MFIMDKQILNKLKEFCKEFYTDYEYEFSENILKVFKEFQLDIDSNIAAYLMKLDLNQNLIKEKILTEFGNKVFNKLEMLSRLSSITIPESSKQISNLRKQIIEIVDDLSVIFLKLGEKLVTLKMYEKYNNPNLLQVAEECLYLYSPIAHRLGIRVIYQEMDDIAFKHLYPKDFNKLFAEVEKRRTQLEKKLSNIKLEVIKKLTEYKIEAKIYSRVKRLYSIFLKLKNKGVTLDNVFDLMAIRIVLNKVEDCYLVLGIIHSNWVPIEGRFRDWITFPKPNGYRSIQTTVINRNGDKFEVQIRTEQMHREAEYGSAAHWAYKEGKSANNELWISRLKEFLDNDEYFKNPYELQELLKSEIKRNYIHVLTPKGDIKTLRAGSTPIDFAYAIHTDLGAKVVGTKINGKLAKLKTELKSGDVIEIISSKTAKPSRDWLNFVKTPKARSKILIWIKKHEKQQLIEDGKRLWEKFKKSNKRKLKDYADEQSFRKNLPLIGFKSSEDFYSAISINSLKLSQTLLRKLYPEAFRKKKRKVLEDIVSSSKNTPKVKIEGLSGIETTLAKCCNPVKGEKILAYITKKSNIKIHTIDCSYLKKIPIDSDRIKKAEWIEMDSKQNIKLKVIGQDYDFMLNAITETAANNRIEVINFARKKNKSDDNIINLEIEVSDIEQLRKFIKQIESSKKISLVSFI